MFLDLWHRSLAWYSYTVLIAYVIIWCVAIFLPVSTTLTAALGVGMFHILIAVGGVLWLGQCWYYGLSLAQKYLLVSMAGIAAVYIASALSNYGVGLVLSDLFLVFHTAPVFLSFLLWCGVLLMLPMAHIQHTLGMLWHIFSAGLLLVLVYNWITTNELYSNPALAPLAAMSILILVVTLLRKQNPTRWLSIVYLLYASGSMCYMYLSDSTFFVWAALLLVSFTLLQKVQQKQSISLLGGSVMIFIFVTLLTILLLPPATIHNKDRLHTYAVNPFSESAETVYRALSRDYASYWLGEGSLSAAALWNNYKPFTANADTVNEDLTQITTTAQTRLFVGSLPTFMVEHGIAGMLAGIAMLIWLGYKMRTILMTMYRSSTHVPPLYYFAFIYAGVGGVSLWIGITHVLVWIPLAIGLVFLLRYDSNQELHITSQPLRLPHRLLVTCFLIGVLVFVLATTQAKVIALTHLEQVHRHKVETFSDYHIARTALEISVGNYRHAYLLHRLGILHYGFIENALQKDSQITLQEGDVQRILTASLLNLSEAVQLDPKSFEYRIALADVHGLLYALGAADAYDTAMEHYNAAHRLQPSHPLPFYARAELTYGAEKYQETLHFIDESLLRMPNYTPAAELQQTLLEMSEQQQ